MIRECWLLRFDQLDVPVVEERQMELPAALRALAEHGEAAERRWLLIHAANFHPSVCLEQRRSLGTSRSGREEVPPTS
eukprot:gene11088-biopygen166